MNNETQGSTTSNTTQLPGTGTHLCVVSETFAPEINGVANTLRHLCLGLSRTGYRVSVVRPRQRSERADTLPEGNMGNHHTLVAGLPLPGYADLRFGLTSAARLQRQWQSDRPDYIYIATQGPLGVAARAAARRLGITAVSGFHTNFHNYSHYYGVGFLEKLLCRYGRWFHNGTAATLVPTSSMKDVVQTMGIQPAIVWGRGVDCQRFAPHKRCEALRANWGLEPTDRAFIYVGRLAAEKNLALAINCFERIRALHPGSRFILVGSGPLQQQIQSRHPDYIFCGNQQGEALARHYASGDIFLFPSKTDTFGNVVTEAMASGLAVVAFDAGAAQEHLIHGENGMVASLEQDEQFIEYALQLADQPTLTSRLKARARMEALELDWESRISRFEQILFNLQQRGLSHGNSKQSYTTF